MFGVSAVILVSGLMLVGGQQQKAEVTNASNDLKELVEGVINTVASGYYQNSGNFKCEKDGGLPKISGGSNAAGTNVGCIFLGKAMQFGVDGDRARINVYGLAGLQYSSGTIETKNLDEAKPTAIAPNSGANSGAPETEIENQNLSFGLRFKQALYDPGAVDINTIAFVSDFATLTSDNNPRGGSRTARLYAIDPSDVGDSVIQIADNITADNFVEVSKISMCFETDIDKFVTLDISGGHQLSTQVQIINDSPAPTTGPCA